MAKLDSASIFQTMKEAGWNPQPLRKREQPDPYPVERLPPVIQDAVEEVTTYVQAPAALIAGCALSAVSAAVQSRYSVRRDAALVGPASLYILTVAESGERKSTVDKMFMAPVREWEVRQARDAKPLIAKYEAELEAWKNSHPRDSKDADLLTELNLSKPAPPRIPRMLRGDDTPEALAKALADYPVAAVISAEAGVIFGSHAMGADSVKRNLAQANSMWDGGPIEQDRISRERIVIDEMRVTMGLQVQPTVLQNFVQKTGGLARGIGYLARFLLSHPESTQGTRYYQDPPASMPALKRFRDRVEFLLTTPAEFDFDGRLVSQEIRLDQKAHNLWRNFHDEVEEEMSCPNDLYFGIRDVASKAAENAARLACCLHVFGNSDHPEISQITMDAACSLMRWYLDEAVRFGRQHAVTEEVHNAELVEAWLVEEFLKSKKLQNVTVNTLRQKGPNPVRARAKLNAALELLSDHGRIRILRGEGTKSQYIHIAPQVVTEWS